MASIYTVAMITGLIIGAFFNPIASIFGGFVGLYIIASLTGKIKPKDFKSRSVEEANKAQDVANGNVGLGSNYDISEF